MTAVRWCVFMLLLAATALAMTACDRVPTTEPDGPGFRTTIPAEWPPDEASARSGAPAGLAAAAKTSDGTFYPLEIGNRWHYTRTDRFQAVEGGVPQPPEVHTGTVSEELTQFETLLDRDYMVAERHIVIPGLGADDHEWIRYRQDRSGLYEADVSILSPPGSPVWPWRFEPLATTPPPPASLVAAAGEKQAREIWATLWTRYRAARAAATRGTSAVAAGPPGGVLPQELVRLAYPLHPGASWCIREDPMFMTAVERREVLELAGQKLSVWRTRIEFELMGPRDVVHVWYGRMGRTGMAYHLEAVITDPAGNPSGVYIFESEEMLDGFDLAGPGGGPAAPAGRAPEAAVGL